MTPRRRAGSIKDRMALHILRRARERGALRAGDVIVEASSGNTGVALAAIGRALGHPVGGGGGRDRSSPSLCPPV
jgi:cysteine synthase